MKDQLTNLSRVNVACTSSYRSQISERIVRILFYIEQKYTRHNDKGDTYLIIQGRKEKKLKKLKRNRR